MVERRRALDDDRLAEVLASVGQHLVVDAAESADVAAAAPVPARRWGARPLLAAALVVAVIAAGVLAVTPARRTVGGWLRGGAVEVRLDPEIEVPEALPTFTDAARRIDPADAEARLGRPLPDLSGGELGAPTEWSIVPEGGVVAGFGDGVTSLWVVAADEALIRKILGDAEQVIDLPELGDGGVAVTGEHVAQTESRVVVADAVVAWSYGPLAFRLESTRPIDDLIAIAKTLAP